MNNDFDSFESYKVGDYVERVRKSKHGPSRFQIESIFVDEGQLYFKVNNGTWFKPDEIDMVEEAYDQHEVDRYL